jgi:hypothetical protein
LPPISAPTFPPVERKDAATWMQAQAAPKELDLEARLEFTGY